MSIEMLMAELDLIKDIHVRDFTEHCLSKAPDYFWLKPSSSTGKYHPAQSNGIGGLIRHTRAVVYFANKLCEVYGLAGLDRDYTLAACILHDIVKYGDNLPHTTKDHDYHGANFIQEAAVGTIYSTIADVIASGVAWHMGQWTKRKVGSTKAFPAGYSRIEEIVHLADVIAAQSQVELVFLREGAAANPPKTVVLKAAPGTMPFGKHKGVPIAEIPSDYLKWAAGELNSADLREACAVELRERNATGGHF